MVEQGVSLSFQCTFQKLVICGVGFDHIEMPGGTHYLR
jgi:hypothetical protein